MNRLVSRLAGYTCWKVPLNNKVVNWFLNSLLALSLPLATLIVLPWLLGSVGSLCLKCTCAAASLSKDSGRFGSSINSNSYASFSVFSIRVGDIDSLRCCPC